MNPTYQGEPETYEQMLARSISEAWGNAPDKCPHCNIGAVWYEHETKTSDGSEYIIGSHCGCTWCNATWYDNVSFFGASPDAAFPS